MLSIPLQGAPLLCEQDNRGTGGMMQDTSVADAVSRFGAAAKAKLANIASTGQPEDQLRNPLEVLFTELAVIAGLPAGATVLVGETSLSDLKTRPDFAVTVSNALTGFIEVKAPGKGADPRKFKDIHDKDQWAKLKSLPNLIYTDGNAFSLWRSGELVGHIAKLDGDIETSGGSLKPVSALLTAIRNFLTWTPLAPRSALELASVSAQLCRFLRDEVVEQMDSGSQPLLDLYADWQTLLFPHADHAQFADGYAQAVTFGLLMAKSLGLALSDDLDPVARKLGQTNSLIGTALRLLTEQPDKVLQTSLRTMTRVLDVVEWDVISNGQSESWLYFYEYFLDVYDRRLRKLTGSYYTPPQVVKTMVRLCDEALKAPGRFAVTQGVAAPNVHIADPATGSGTFLLALIRHIAEAIEADEGAGAVAPKISEAAKRLYGFELQFGAFAVAQLRLLAEMFSLGSKGAPHLFVTDTLADPYEHEETGTGLSRLLSRSRIDANKVKTSQPITVVIGNPPYKKNARGRGGWIENGSGFRKAPLDDWQPPHEWGIGAHAKHLRNLYVYFWRWATWKVFEQGSGARDKEPPHSEQFSGLICYITMSGFLNGPGFEKMRADLRRDCDEIWVIDCSPEGHQPEVATRIFDGVQHAVCIVIASRSPANDPAKPSRVRVRSLSPGKRAAKFKELEALSLASPGWSEAPSDWRGPFLPAFSGGWEDFVPIASIIGDIGSGTMPGRTWVIAPDSETLRRRWAALVSERDKDRRTLLFHPHEGGDRAADKATKGLARHHGPSMSLESALARSSSSDPQTASEAQRWLKGETPIRYGFRSFDRQWIIPDNRLINRPNPNLWASLGPKQVYLTALSRSAPRNGPAATATAHIPDHDHYKGSASGRVFALWKDSAATQHNISAALIGTLSKLYGGAADPVDIFAYVAALVTSPSYTEAFKADLIRPGLRVPLTADRVLFEKGAALGRELLWLHTFGERLSDPGAGRPGGAPRLPAGERPIVPKDGTIPDDANTIEYESAQRQLKIGTGFINNVPQEVWKYEVSGKQVIRQWFSYRKRDRDRPQIGDKRPPSPLETLQPDHWLPEYTTELLELINVLGLLVKIEPRQANLLNEICEGPLIESTLF